MDLIGPILDFVNLLRGPIGRQVNYSRKLGEKFQKLEEDAQDLSNRKKGINEELKNSVGKIATDECKSWFKKVEDTEKEIKKIEEKYNPDQKCFFGLCPDIVSRMSLGKHVIQVSNLVRDLVEKCKFEGSFVRDAPPPTIEPVQLPNIVEKTSVERTLQKVLGYMRDERVHRLGIWGMGGVGKTTLMKALNNSSEISTSFELVIWVTVSKHGSVGSVQKEIASRLKLDVSSEETNERFASKISQYLDSKKFLLLLDDVWESIDLAHVGIPNPNEQKNGSKIMLTTRFETVCNEMETDENVKVDVLSEKEAWDLFSRKVGDVANLEDITPLAKDVVKECDGLPLAINVLGGVLRNTADFHVWRNALRQLRSPASSSIGHMEDRVFKPLKFSYDHLEDDNIKQCFLYCALYPEDYNIKDDELVEYWRAEGLIDGTKNIVEAYDKGCDILNTLVKSSLLEMCGAHLYVMHDVLRDLALKIASPKGNDVKFLVRAGIGDRSPPMEKEWKEMKRISLMSNDLDSLPVCPDCHMLSTLLLQGNKRLGTIPDEFFEKMEHLRVLDLSNTNITSLPSSISKLIHLRGLYLSDCLVLAKLPEELGALKYLETLQIENTDIEVLWPDLDEKNVLSVKMLVLTHLTCLMVSSDMSGVIFPLAWISKLSLLEHLVILVPKNNAWWMFHMNAIVEEVASLRNLRKLQFHFPKVEHLQLFLSSSQSWIEESSFSFQFFVGLYKSSQREKECSGSLIYAARDDIMIPDAITQVLSRSQKFELEENNVIKKLSEFGVENMKGLKRCVVRRCHAVEILANGKEEEDDVLPNLEVLELHVLSKLRNIVEGSLSPKSFANLKRLDLMQCQSLKYIFPWSMVKQLSKLESLSISGCNQLEDIFKQNDIEMVTNGDYQLSNLKYLILVGLPNLDGNDKILTLALSSIERIVILSCGIKSLPSSLVNAPMLRKIEGTTKWWNEELKWEDDTVKQGLQPIFQVYR